MARFISILAVVALLSPVAFAAIVHGSVYDELLEQARAVVKVNTVPEQMVVAANGSYSFDLPPGTYVLRARAILPGGSLGEEAVENVTIAADGSYRLDLLLPFQFDSLDDVVNETASNNLPSSEDLFDAPPAPWWHWAAAFAAISLIALLAVSFLRTPRQKAVPKETSEPPEEKKQDNPPFSAASPVSHHSHSVPLSLEEEEILAFVRKQGGVTTQKELRKALPYGEARVSLLVSALGKQGKLKVIKQGRGNILKL